MKRLISVLMVFVLLLSYSTINVFSEAVPDTDALAKLYAFGVTDSATDDFARPVTRIEMVKYAVRLYGPHISLSASDTCFADIPKENEASGIVNFALAKGIISEAAMFYPERTIRFEEAVKMIVTALDYGELAMLKGGYPYGYTQLASGMGLLNNVVAGEGNGLTFVTVVKMLENALSAGVCDASLIINKNGEAEYLFSDSKGETVLNKRFGVSKYGAFVTDVSTTSYTLKADIVSKEKNDAYASYKAGDKAILTISKRASVGDIKFTYSDMYVNENDEVVYATVQKNTEVVTGFIYEINKEHNKANVYPSYIKNIGFENEEEYFDVSSECIMNFNEEGVDSKAYPFVGAFARAVIQNDEIIALEAWQLSEGGLVTRVGDSEIDYRRGETPVVTLSDIFGYKDVTIFINGIKSELWALVSDVTIFDFFKTEDKSKLMIVASTRAITDTFERIGTNGLNIGGDDYPLSTMYNVYYALDGTAYMKNADVYSLLGRTVTANVDCAGYVRYVRPVLDDELNTEYYAFVFGYNQQGLSDPELQVYVLGETVEKKIFSLTENVVKNQKLLLDNIKIEADVLAKADITEKNEVIKHRNLMFKIRVNDNGQISYLRPAPRFSEPVLDELYSAGKTGYAITDFTSEAKAYTTSGSSKERPKKIIFDKAQICALYYDEEGELIARNVAWDGLKAKSGSGIWMSPFAQEDSSEVELMLMRGDLQSIGYTRTDYIKNGFLSEIFTGYDKTTEKEVTNVVIDGTTYSVKKYKDSLKDVTDAAYIEYATGNTFLAEDEIKIGTVYNLSGLPESWTLAAERADGLHKDEVSKTDSRRVHFTSGDKWYIADKAPVYELVEANGKIKFVASSRGEIPYGADAWYIFYNYEIKVLMFRR